jgi:hypothetical protein
MTATALSISIHAITHDLLQPLSAKLGLAARALSLAAAKLPIEASRKIAVDEPPSGAETKPSLTFALIAPKLSINPSGPKAA